jgi:copper chaperone
MKFKTNIKCDACVSKVTPSLNEVAGEQSWQVDLKDPNRTLTILKAIDEQRLKQSLEKVGYRAERID